MDARSRDLDLQTRLFKYPCSYLVYSPSFAVLPHEVKDYVLHRKHEVLNGRTKAINSHTSPLPIERPFKKSSATLCLIGQASRSAGRIATRSPVFRIRRTELFVETMDFSTCQFISQQG